MKPLEGIKVIDLTTYLAAPTTVRCWGNGARTASRSNQPKATPPGPRALCSTCPTQDDENLAFVRSQF